jgi:hypothetical protein
MRLGITEAVSLIERRFMRGPWEYNARGLHEVSLQYSLVLS